MSKAPGGRVEPASTMRVLEHVPVMAYLLRAKDDDFVLEGVNAAARSKTPALQAMLGRPISLLYADQPGMIADAHRCLREGVRIESVPYVRRHGRVDGTPLRLVFAPLDAEHIVIYAQDSPEEGTARAELHELSERYRSLLESLPEAMLLRGADGRVVACNDTAARLLGFEAASDLWGKVDLLGDRYRMEDANGASLPSEATPSRRSAQTGTVIRGELYRCVDPTGEFRWLRVSAQPLMKADGSLGGSVTLFTDETEHLEARRAERDAALQLQLALDAGRMGTWRYDPIADQGDWSKSLDQAFGFHDERPAWRDYLDRIYADDRAEAARVMSEVLSAPDGTTFEHEHRLVGDDGAIRWVKIRGRIERQGSSVRMLGTAMDITERRRMQDELHHASRLESLGRLAGGVAHDFNNMLAAMLNTIELLGDVCPADGKEDLATLRHVTLRARDLTAQLLAFARQQRIELETLEVSELVRKAERLLERLVGPTIRLVISLPNSPLYVRADAAQLEQVLVNLVVNARDAMPAGGEIQVQAQRAQEHVVIEVRDQGNGINPEHLAHVFDPFFTTKKTGTGLGLASSYGVVQSHGGTLTVESATGRGACFKITLPRLAVSASTPRVVTKAERGHGYVLVVDDDDDVRRTTARMLRSLGYEVTQAGCGEEARTLAQRLERKLDILVCDLVMPHQPGPEVAVAIRTIYPDIKVLFISGYPNGIDRELPAETFLQKPFDRETLGRKLAALAVPPGPTKLYERLNK